MEEQRKKQNLYFLYARKQLLGNVSRVTWMSVIVFYSLLACNIQVTYLYTGHLHIPECTTQTIHLTYYL